MNSSSIDIESSSLCFTTVSNHGLRLSWTTIISRKRRRKEHRDHRCSVEGTPVFIKNILVVTCARKDAHVVPRLGRHGTAIHPQGSVCVNQRVYKMRSFQQKLSIFTGNTTHLLTQISELNELRARLEKALRAAQRSRQPKRRKRMRIRHSAHP
jgi:hypothetical protein